MSPQWGCSGCWALPYNDLGAKLSLPPWQGPSMTPRAQGYFNWRP